MGNAANDCLRSVELGIEYTSGGVKSREVIAFTGRRMGLKPQRLLTGGHHRHSREFRNILGSRSRELNLGSRSFDAKVDVFPSKGTGRVMALPVCLGTTVAAPKGCKST